MDFRDCAGQAGHGHRQSLAAGPRHASLSGFWDAGRGRALTQAITNTSSPLLRSFDGDVRTRRAEEVAQRPYLQLSGLIGRRGVSLAMLSRPRSASRMNGASNAPFVQDKLSGGPTRRLR